MNERAGRIPHELGAHGGGARYFALRILQDHVKHGVVDNAALTTALIKVACPQTIQDWRLLLARTLDVDYQRRLY